MLKHFGHLEKYANDLLFKYSSCPGSMKSQREFFENAIDSKRIDILEWAREKQTSMQRNNKYVDMTYIKYDIH